MCELSSVRWVARLCELSCMSWKAWAEAAPGTQSDTCPAKPRRDPSNPARSSFSRAVKAVAVPRQQKQLQVHKVRRLPRKRCTKRCTCHGKTLRDARQPGAQQVLHAKKQLHGQSAGRCTCHAKAAAEAPRTGHGACHAKCAGNKGSQGAAPATQKQLRGHQVLYREKALQAKMFAANRRPSAQQLQTPVVGVELGCVSWMVWVKLCELNCASWGVWVWVDFCLYANYMEWRGAAGYTCKNKNPTQRCGEKWKSFEQCELNRPKHGKKQHKDVWLEAARAHLPRRNAPRPKATKRAAANSSSRRTKRCTCHAKTRRDPRRPSARQILTWAPERLPIKYCACRKSSRRST